MGLDLTTDEILIDSGILLLNDFQRLTDKTKFPTGTEKLHVKARDRILKHMRELPERVEVDSLSNPTQFHDAQLHYVAYQMYRRAHMAKKRDQHFKWFQEELSIVDPEVDGQETREMKWNRGVLLERG